jgi:hypothetical protein
MNQILPCALLCSLVAAPADAQERIAQAQTVPRVATRLAFWTRDYGAPLGQACIEYAQPAWKDEYEQRFEQARSTRVRLGSDFWTTLDTNTTMSVADRTVPIGQWYLGLSCSEKGEWSLAVYSPERVRDVKGDASDTPSLKPVIEARLAHARSETSVEKLTIDLKKREEAFGEGTLVIAWGKHVLSAPIVMNVARAGPQKPTKTQADTKDRAETKARLEIRMIDDAIKTYFVMNGKVPRMEDLTTRDRNGRAFLEGFVGQQEPTDPWGTPYEIKAGEMRGSWDVLSYGPDKASGTADDLSSRDRK